MALSTSSDPYQRMDHFSYLVGARSSHEHLRQADRAMWGS
jgi:hypothetical protein